MTGAASARASLREFSSALAQRLAAAPQGTAGARWLAVRIGSTDYLVPLADAGQIVSLPAVAPVPWTQPWFRGLANVRGRLVGVIDLAQLAGAPPLAPEQARQLLVLGERLPAPLGLLVTRAFGLRDEAALQPDAAASGRVPWQGRGWRGADGTAFFELNLGALMADERFAAIGV